MANYRRAPYFEQVFSDFKILLQLTYPNIADLNIAIVTFICNKFGFKTRLVKSSSLKIKQIHEARIIEICMILGSDTYYSGTGASNYQNPEHFERSGISLKYSDFTPFVYPQLWQGYQSNVTVLDYLMNCGYDWERVVDSQKR